ncbi:fasciclin-like arabinogalactan protein 11 [Panicum miliaceum]|uniref:Fasciclin-like arabinogalactan protein 11 n=1 Tax=Panicum miliaceum TaxID=4540 RepID=A0A3L6T1W5_PANMI|nr:fasciclin-like arabinogalactan protein 11 [Panicum miliaceum]
MAARSLLAAAFLALAVPAVLCQAPGPAAPKGPPNVTAILEKGGQYATFIRLMKATQQDTQLNSQLNNSFGSGYTVFAPTDNAFNSLKPGTLNKLSQQEQVSLVQYHILPQFYSLDSFETASNPVRTQASGSDGPYTLNITADSNNQVNVSTGLVATRVGTALRDTQPLAVYSVDKVLLPNDLFGVKPPSSAPPAPTKKPAKGGSVAEAPAGSADSAPAGAAPAGARVAGWSLAALVLAAAGSLL